MDTVLPICVPNADPATRTTGKTANPGDGAAESLFAGLFAGLFAPSPQTGDAASVKQVLPESCVSLQQSAVGYPVAHAVGDRKEDGQKAAASGVEDCAARGAALVPLGIPVVQVAESVALGSDPQPVSAASGHGQAGIEAVVLKTTAEAALPQSPVFQASAGVGPVMQALAQGTPAVPVSGAQAMPAATPETILFTPPVAVAAKPETPADPQSKPITKTLPIPEAGSGKVAVAPAVAEFHAAHSDIRRAGPKAAGDSPAFISDGTPVSGTKGSEKTPVFPEPPPLKDIDAHASATVHSDAVSPATKMPADPSSGAAPPADRGMVQKYVLSAAEKNVPSENEVPAVRKPEAGDEETGSGRTDGVSADGRYGAVDTLSKTGTVPHVIKTTDLPRTITVQEQTFQVTKLSDTKLEVTVHPEGLGKLDIEVNLSSGQIHARISAADIQVKQMLERNMPDILNALTAEGYNVGGFSVGLRDGREHMQQQPQDERPAGVKPVAAAESLPVRSLTNNTVSIFV